MTRAMVVLAIGLCAAWTGSARAVDQPVAGRQLKVRDVVGSRRSLDLTAMDPSIVPESLPTGDTRFRIWSAAGEFDFLVMSSLWASRANGRVLKLRDFDRRGKVLIKSGFLRLKVPLPDGFSLDEPFQGSIGVSFTAGATRYCALFGGTTITDEPGRFVARDAPAPSSCPDLCAEDAAGPTVSIADFFETPPIAGDPDRYTVSVDATDDRELHHVDYATHDLVGCPLGTACDAPCWTRGGVIDTASCYCFELDRSEGSFVAPGCAKCIDVTATAVDSCGRTGAEAILRTQVSCASFFCCS